MMKLWFRWGWYSKSKMVELLLIFSVKCLKNKKRKKEKKKMLGWNKKKNIHESDET